MLNKFFTIGRLCRSNELKAMSNGTFVLENDLAFDSLSKDKQGKYETNFIKVVFYGKTAESVAKYTNKGSLIEVEGWLKQNNRIGKDGKKVSYYSLVATTCTFLGKKDEVALDENSDIPVLDEDLPF